MFHSEFDMTRQQQLAPSGNQGGARSRTVLSGGKQCGPQLEDYFQKPPTQGFQTRPHRPNPSTEFSPRHGGSASNRSPRVYNSSHAHQSLATVQPPADGRTQVPHRAVNQHTYSCDQKGYLNFEVGLILNGCYRLEKRIGKGTFSKVFAALDMRTSNWVAVKVVRNSEKYQLAAKIELHILNMILKEDTNDNSRCVHLLDQFVHHGHPCFVFDLLGRNLYSFLHSNRYMPFALTHVKTFIRQILEAVHFLHKRNVIFTDLKPENIVFVHDRTVKRQLGGSEIEIPKDTRIRLIDFGSALYGDRHHTHLVQTRHYRAPEVILGIPWRFEIDIWSVGCIILELLTGRMVFNTHDSVDHLSQMERLIDRMPQSLKRKATNFQELFHNDFTLKMENARISPSQCIPLDEYFAKVLYMYPKLELCRDLVRRMLQWNAADRITAADALMHPYFSEC